VLEIDEQEFVGGADARTALVGDVQRGEVKILYLM
jgi:hypothetical protein